jgi:hypothetical protein
VAEVAFGGGQARGGRKESAQNVVCNKNISN